MQVFNFYLNNVVKNFFFDKHKLINNYKFFKISKLYISIPFANMHTSKSFFYKSLIFLYCLSGVKPNIQIKKVKINGRGIKKKQVTNLFLSLTGLPVSAVLYFIIFRRLPLIKFFQFFSLTSHKVFSFNLKVALGDDDLLLQMFNFSAPFKMHVSLFMNPFLSISYIKSFLVSLKIPIKV